MPIAVQCPGCNRKLNVPDKVAGKKIKCSECTKVFEVPDAGFEVVVDDDFEVIADSPAAAKQKSGEGPKTKSKVIVEDDSAVDEEDQPRRKTGKKKQPPKSNMPLKLGIGGLVLVVAVVGAVFAFKGKGNSNSTGSGGGTASINWVKYNAPDASYTAYFPNGIPSTRDMESIAKEEPQSVQQMKTMGFTFDGVSRIDSNKEFGIAIFGFPQLMVSQAEKDLAKPIAKGRLNAGFPGMDAGEVLDSSSVTVGGKSAKQILVKTDNGRYIITRMFMAGEKLVIIAVESSSEIKADDSVIQEFFSKFEWKK